MKKTSKNKDDINNEGDLKDEDNLKMIVGYAYLAHLNQCHCILELLVSLSPTPAQTQLNSI